MAPSVRFPKTVHTRSKLKTWSTRAHFATHSMTTTTAMPILQTFNSPPPSPLLSRPSSQSPRGSPLRLPAVANAIVKFRRGRHNSPAKDFPIVSSSGAPQTHPTLAGDAGIAIRGSVPLIEEQRFLCRDAVDVKKLLRMLRGVLLEEAQTIGASVLVDEQWTCTIHSPRRDGVYKVDIRYAAGAARSNTPDPQHPVALENARGVPGLMTVVG